MQFKEFFDAIHDIKNNRIFTLENENVNTLTKEITFFHYIKAISLLDCRNPGDTILNYPFFTMVIVS